MLCLSVLRYHMIRFLAQAYPGSYHTHELADSIHFRRLNRLRKN
jgi:hypothetical protein